MGADGHHAGLGVAEGAVAGRDCGVLGAGEGTEGAAVMCEDLEGECSGRSVELDAMAAKTAADGTTAAWQMVETNSALRQALARARRCPSFSGAIGWAKIRAEAKPILDTKAIREAVTRIVRGRGT